MPRQPTLRSLPFAAFCPTLGQPHGFRAAALIVCRGEGVSRGAWGENRNSPQSLWPQRSASPFAISDVPPSCFAHRERQIRRSVWITPCQCFLFLQCMAFCPTLGQPHGFRAAALIVCRGEGEFRGAWGENRNSPQSLWPQRSAFPLRFPTFRPPVSATRGGRLQIPGNSHSRAKRSLRFPTFRLPVSPTGRGRLQSQPPSSLRAG